MVQRIATRKPAHAARGFSTIEALVAAAIASTLTATAAGHISQWRTQLAVTETAAALETDLQWARSEALARQQTVVWAWEQTEQGTCWLVYTGTKQACHCGSSESSPAACTESGELLRSVFLPTGHPVAVSANVKSLSFDATLGTVTPSATVRLSADGAKAMHQVVGIMGRVRTCIPGGGLPGYRPC